MFLPSFTAGSACPLSRGPPNVCDRVLSGVLSLFVFGPLASFQPLPLVKAAEPWCYRVPKRASIFTPSFFLSGVSLSTLITYFLLLLQCARRSFLTLPSSAYPFLPRVVFPTTCTLSPVPVVCFRTRDFFWYLHFVLYEASPFDLSSLGLPVFGRIISLRFGFRF